MLEPTEILCRFKKEHLYIEPIINKHAQLRCNCKVSADEPNHVPQETGQKTPESLPQAQGLSGAHLTPLHDTKHYDTHKVSYDRWKAT